MMFRRFMNALRGRSSPELEAAFIAHRRAVERRVAGSRQTTAIVRDVRLNTRSAIEAVDHSWDPK